MVREHLAGVNVGTAGRRGRSRTCARSTSTPRSQPSASRPTGRYRPTTTLVIHSPFAGPCAGILDPFCMDANPIPWQDDRHAHGANTPCRSPSP